MESLARHAGQLGDLRGGHGRRAVQTHRLGILFHRGRRRGMDSPATGYLPFSFSTDSLLAYLDAIFNQLLVVEYQVLFQSGVGDIAAYGGILHRDITVGAQKFHRLGVPRGRLSFKPNRCRSRSRNSSTSG